MSDTNLILDSDSYKFSHPSQYPPGSTKQVAYLCARKGAQYDQTVFFGLQYILKEYLVGSVVTVDDVEFAKDFMSKHGEPFAYDGWMKVVTKHGGKLPLRIRAVPEGSLVPVGQCLMTVESTDPEPFWLPGWVETMLMRAWYPCTVATRSFYCKRVIKSYLDLTADDPDSEINFKLHDFGSRGVSSRESAAIGGMAHLVNFMGSDTVWGVNLANMCYGKEGDMFGYSIPAMEHSTVISWGPKGEIAAFMNMIEKHPDNKLIACVSDSYDIYNAVRNIWAEPNMVKHLTDLGKTVVIRPDSGDPVEVNLEILRILDEKIGCIKNTKGYKVLPDCFRIIQGDGNNDESDIKMILRALATHGYSASNMAFGMGGGLLQKLDRDTQRFAYKLCAITVDGERRAVSKSPATDPSKASTGGYLDLIKDENGEYKTVATEDGLPHPNSELVTVFENGELKVDYSFDEVRARAKEAL